MTETISDDRDRLIHILVVHFGLFRYRAEEAADLFLNDKTLASRHQEPVNEPADGNATAARFNRLYGICRRILWTDASTPAMGNTQTRAAFDDLAEFLFADGIDASLQKQESGE